MRDQEVFFDNTLGDVQPPIVMLSQEKLHKAMLQKSAEWEYEKEWRLLPKHISLEHVSNLGYIRILPKAIILGAKCEESAKRKIQEICEKKKIPLFKMALNFLEPRYTMLTIPFKERIL